MSMPRGRRQLLTFRADDALERAVRQAAQAAGLSISSYLHRVVRERLERPH